MVVRYSRTWAYVLLGLGIVCVGLYFLGAGKAGHWGLVVAGAACLAIGACYLFRPYFTLEESRIVVPAPLGPSKRTYEFAPGGLSLEGNKVFSGQGDARRKLPLSRSLARPDDWWAFLETAGLVSDTRPADSGPSPSR